MGVAVCLAAWMAFGVAIGLSQDNQLAKLYGEARAAEAKEDYRTATQRYERIVTLRPDLAEAHANLGNLYYVQGQATLAATAFKNAIRLKPELATPHLFLGILSFNVHDFGSALRYLQTAAGLEPSNVLTALYLGYTYYALSNYQKAAASMEKVTVQEVRNQDAWYHLSKVHGQLSKQYFEKLQKQYPDSFYTHLARSHFYESNGNWEQARVELSLALEKHPGTDSLQRRIEWLGRKTADSDAPPPAVPADLLAGSTRYLYSPPEGELIREAYEAERSHTPTSGEQKEDSAAELYEQAERRQALSFLSSLWVLTTNGDSYRACQLRGESLEAAGKLDEAIAEYRRALSLKPTLQTIHFAIGNIHWRRGRFEEALPELQEELKLNPNDAHSHYEVGDILFSQNKPAEAEKHFLQAGRLSATPEAHLALERIATAKDDFNKALFHLRKAAQINPDDPTPHYRMWSLYRKLGNRPKAQKERQIFEKLKEKEKLQGKDKSGTMQVGER